MTNTDVICKELGLGQGVSFTKRYNAANLWTAMSTVAMGFDDVVCDVTDTSNPQTNRIRKRERAFLFRERQTIRRALVTGHRYLDVRVSSGAVQVPTRLQRRADDWTSLCRIDRKQ